MIGIKSIGSFIPDSSIDNIDQALKFGETEDFIRKKIGATRLSKMPKEMETSDLAVGALNALLQKSALAREDIEALVVVTQNPDGCGLPHTSAIVQDKGGLPTGIAAFDISLGCSGYVYGISIVKGLMETAGLRNAVLITADPYSKVIDPTDRITALLFGDAATATWLGEAPVWDIAAPLFATDGSGATHLKVENNKLCMNGRQVFNFASITVPKQLRQYLEQHNLKDEDIDLYCMHQGSAAIVNALSRRFPTVANRFIFDMDQTGNTISSSIPLLLEDRLNDPALSKILVSGFGVGLSWATTLLRRN